MGSPISLNKNRGNIQKFKLIMGLMNYKPYPDI
jgi:hypothetical protein